MSGADPTEPDRAPRVPTRLPTCHAMAKSGQPCKRPVVPGATVCRYHGGNAPQVKRKAALRLLELVDPAIATLAREMVQADKSSDRQRAANSILDRAGVPRETAAPDGDMLRDLLVERLRSIREQQEQDEIDAAAEAEAASQSETAPTILIQSQDAPTNPEQE